MAQYQHTDEARSRKLQPLCEAQAHPEQHRDLIVRVAGYSDYFCDLTTALQDEIIARTEQTGF
jgi:formate C-acetyltransferase